MEWAWCSARLSRPARRRGRKSLQLTGHVVEETIDDAGEELVIAHEAVERGVLVPDETYPPAPGSEAGEPAGEHFGDGFGMTGFEI